MSLRWSCCAARFGMSAILASIALLPGVAIRADDATQRYFEGLRQRRLFSVAEGYCLEQLGQETTDPGRRAELTLELSRTLVEHARHVAGDEQADLWRRATDVLTRALEESAPEPERTLLTIQQALVPFARGEALRWQVELFPDDETLRREAVGLFEATLPRLEEVEQSLSERHAASVRRKPERESLRPWELRKLLVNVRYQLATAQVDFAHVLASGSADRVEALLDAEELLESLAGSGSGNELSWNSRLLLAECRRLRGNLADAEAVLASIDRDQPPQAVLDRVLAERVRLDLRAGRPDDAAQRLSEYRARHAYPPGELCYLDVQTLNALRQIAVESGDDALASELLARIDASVARAQRDVGGYWAWRCGILGELAHQASRYGSELAAMIRRAQGAYAGGRIEDALADYAAAARAAEDAGHAELGFELEYTRGSILVESGQFEAAAEVLGDLAASHSTHPQASSAHLLHAYALGRLYEQDRTSSRQQAFRQALLDHRQRYADDPTVHDATFMLAALEERRRQWQGDSDVTGAVPLYRLIPADHPRGVDARLGIARCHESTLNYHRQALEDLPAGQRAARRQWIADLESSFIAELTEMVASQPRSAPPTDAREAEIALRLARMHLRREQPDYAEADAALAWVLSARPGADDPALARWRPVLDTAMRLRVVSLASQRQFEQAGRLLHALSAGNPADLLAVLNGLGELSANLDELARQNLGRLQLEAATELDRRREELDGPGQRLLDECLAKAFLAVERPAQAVEVYDRLLSNDRENRELLRSLGAALEQCGSVECLRRAKETWRTLEGLERPGSADWLAARYRVAANCFQLGQYQECEKLLSLTRLLYPELGGDALSTQFASLQRELNAARARQ